MIEIIKEDDLNPALDKSLEPMKILGLESDEVALVMGYGSFPAALYAHGDRFMVRFHAYASVAQFLEEILKFLPRLDDEIAAHPHDWVDIDYRAWQLRQAAGDLFGFAAIIKVDKTAQPQVPTETP